MRLMWQLLHSPSFWIALAVAGVVDGLVWLTNPSATRNYGISGVAFLVALVLVGLYRNARRQG